MNESKISLTERLRGEGRWIEASRFKDSEIARLRSEGMKRSEASEAAWEAMAAEYPALEPNPEQTETAGGSQTPVKAVAPPVPWSGLPVEANFDEEVRWVHQQYISIVEETPRGPVVHWDRASIIPPSTGACSLALWAAENRTAFYKDLLPKTVAKWGSGTSDDDKIANEDDPGIEEINAILDTIQADMVRELRESIPSDCHSQIRQIVATWSAKFGLSLAADPREQLELEFCKLIRDVRLALGV